MVKRVLIYSLGLLFLAFGVSFSIKSNLGVSPINSLPYVLSIVTKLSQGVLTTAIFSCYVILQIVILRKEFKLKNLFQIVFAGLFGYFVSFSNMLMQDIQAPTNYIIRLLFLSFSILCVGIGLLLYLAVDVLPQPPEGLMIAISKKTGIEMHKIKVYFDCTVVVIAIIISVVAFGKLEGVREGTVISAILIGKVLGVFMKKWKSKVVGYAFR